MTKILIVEDEDKLRKALERGLTEEGFEVVVAANGDEGFARASAEPFDCVILDRMLPGRDGLGLLAEMRSIGLITPVLMLSARGATEDRVQGLDIGADDYLAKPFAWSELLARVRACVRRGSAENLGTLRWRGIEVDRAHRRLNHEAGRISLTAREFELLDYLLRRAGHVVSREELAHEVWQDRGTTLTNVIDVYINQLRKKLLKAGVRGAIQTARGVGYILGE